MNEPGKSFRRRSWEWLERRIAQEIRAAAKLRRSHSRRKPFVELLADHTEAQRRRRNPGRG